MSLLRFLEYWNCATKRKDPLITIKPSFYASFKIKTIEYKLQNNWVKCYVKPGRNKRVNVLLHLVIPVKILTLTRKKKKFQRFMLRKVLAFSLRGQ